MANINLNKGTVQVVRALVFLILVAIGGNIYLEVQRLQPCTILNTIPLSPVEQRTFKELGG